MWLLGFRASIFPSVLAHLLFVLLGEEASLGASTSASPSPCPLLLPCHLSALLAPRPTENDPTRGLPIPKVRLQFAWLPPLP